MDAGRLMPSTRIASWNGKYNKLDGSTPANAAPSAMAIKQLTGTENDGVYWIDLPTSGPTQTFCIMNSAYNGGGWMMAMKATRGTTFNYTANYWTTDNTLNPTRTNQDDGDAKFDVMNKFSGKDLLAVFPDINSGTGGSITGLGKWTWLENNYYGGTSSTLINFFNNVSVTSGIAGSGYFKGDAKLFSGWASGIWSSQTDIRFYGFNYMGYNSATGPRSRWGFGWNENGEGLFPGGSSGAAGSNDVFGGIGMGTSGGYSAGDYISCCSDTTGINRSARVEMYIR